MVKQPPELKKRILSVKQLRQTKQSLGLDGEVLAQKYLESKNYRIIATNIQIGLTEIDIIAVDKNFDELVFVEVKTRGSDSFGHASRAVGHKKITAMRKVAAAFLKSTNRELRQKDYRFDIITVTGSELEHFENITWP